MTEFELTDAINSTMSIYATCFSLYLTIISAYLIAGFVAGDRLTTQQFLIVSVLFLFASGLTTFAMSGAGTRIAYAADALRLLDAENRIGVSLTESFAMSPAASVSGLYFSHPESRYFSVGKISKDQIRDLASRKSMDVDTLTTLLSPNL